MHTCQSSTLVALASQLPRAFRKQLFLACLLALLILGSASRSTQAATAVIPPGVKLNTPEMFFGDEFGHAVAIDGNFIVASAWRKNVGDIKEQGVVYIFERDANDPLLYNVVKTLTAGDARASHGFGAAVAIHGNTVVVGAIYDNDNGHFQAGAAYVFERNQGGANNWGQVKKLVDANFDNQFSEHGYMGGSVAVHGDTIVVGAPKARGRAFVFERNRDGANNWGEAQVLSAEYWERGSYGTSLAFDGTRLVVGVSLSSIVPGRFNNEGAVFIFEHNDIEWVQTGKLIIGDNDPETDFANNSRFGTAVALYGDTIYVGAPSLEVNGALLVGSTFVFEHIIGGQWIPAGAIAPTNIAFGNSFGSSLYAVANGVFIASDEGDNGTVYFYQRVSSAAHSANAAATDDSWTQAFSFSTTEPVSDSRFGRPMVGSGNTFVAAASGMNAGQGGVTAYPLDQLLANAPSAPSGEGGAFLPMVVYDPQQIPIQTVAGTLANNGILTGPEDFKIGAVVNTLTETVDLTIATVSPPAQALPDGITPRSSYYLLSAEQNLLVDMDSPFVVSFPVPAGADTGHLALAYLHPEGEVLDNPTTEPAWGFLPGAYDAEHNLFLAKLPFLQKDGANLILVEHPDLQSPLNAPALQAVTAQNKPFTAFCYHDSFPQAGGCTPTMATAVKNQLDEIYTGMVNQYGFPAKLRLLDSGSQFIVSLTYSVTAANATYAAYIFHKSTAMCARGKSAGVYSPEDGMLIICLDNNQTVDGDVRSTLIHELFHAIQFTYPQVMIDRTLRRQQDWIIEGTATAAMKSYGLGKMARAFNFGFENLRKVNMPLTEGTVTDAVLDEYYSQDFWVYVGQSLDTNLGYLRSILALGGANITTMNAIWRVAVEGDTPLADDYWDWVKNQSIEHSLDLGGGPGETCKLTKEALINGEHVSFPSSDQYYPKDRTWVTLPPLTAQVVQVQIPHTDDALLVTTLYQECGNNSEPDVEYACLLDMKKFMRAKLYVEGEADCQNAVLPGMFGEYEGERIFGPIEQGKRYFVIVANADPKQSHGFAIRLE